MAAGTLPAPGSHAGPCADACEHTDCKATREMSAKACPYCREEIGYSRRFYVEGTNLAHAACVENAQAHRAAEIQKGENR